MLNFRSGTQIQSSAKEARVFGIELGLQQALRDKRSVSGHQKLRQGQSLENVSPKLDSFERNSREHPGEDGQDKKTQSSLERIGGQFPLPFLPFGRVELEEKPLGKRYSERIFLDFLLFGEGRGT